MQWYWILLFLVPVLNASQCPGPHWKARRGSSYCYLISTALNRPSVSWADAQKDCKGRGGRLADIENLEEFDYLTTRLGNTPLFYMNYWLGLSYESGSWRWTDIDTPFVPNSLGSFSPDNVGEFKALAATDPKRRLYRAILSHEDDGNTRLTVQTSRNEGPLGGARYKDYICKANFSNRPLCKTDEGWDYVHDRCWKSMRELSDWRTASNTCLGLGGYVAVPNSNDENQRLSNIAVDLNVQTTWLGLNFQKTAETDPKTLTWADGTNLLNASYNAPWSYPNLEATINGFAVGPQYCGYLSRPIFTGQAKWYLDGNCNDKKPYSCESNLEICPYGWTSFMGFCYQFRISDDDVRNFAQASGECTAQGGNLVVIYNAFVQLFLQDHIANLGLTNDKQPNFWIGYTSQASSAANQFVWNAAEGVVTTPDFTNWINNTTPSSSSSRCAYLQANQNEKTAFWAAGDCAESIGYVCQAQPQKVVQFTALHPDLKCDLPFTRYHEACFYISPERTSWDQAKSECLKLNSTLVEIETGGENKYLTQRISIDSWIGVRRRPYTNAQGQQRYYSQYSDNRNLTDMSYTNYELGVANDDHRFCFFMHAKDSSGGLIDNTGAWDVEDCTAAKPYICHHRGDFVEPVDPIDVVSVECGEGWILMDKHCYKFIPEMVNYRLAEQTCRNQGQHSSLLYITSSTEAAGIKELDFKTSEFESSDSYWTALQITAPNQWFWKYRDSNEKWSIPMTYTNWAPNEPSLLLSYSTTTPMCAYIRADQGLQWAADSCNKLRPYICKKKAEIPTQPFASLSPPPMNYTYGCLNTWIKSGEHCFQRNDTYVTWSQAELSCNASGASLANLFSPEQHQLMLHLLNGAWIGMNSIDQPKDPRQFVNGDSTSPVYTPWLNQISRPGVNSLSDANCVASLDVRTTNGADSLTIAQYSCAETRPYVCMMPLLALELQPAECVKPPEDKGCRRWGYGHRSSCFYMGNDPGSPLGTREPLTFDGARRFCQEYFGGDLAVINTDHRQEFMSVLLGTWASDYWIGLQENGSAWTPFTTWINDESIAISNWAHGQPARHHQGKSCVALHGTRSDFNLPGQWYVAGCQDMKFALCEAPRVGWTNLPVVPTPSASGCPNGWTSPDVTSKNCYKAFYAPDSTPGSKPTLTKLTWQEAEDSCADFTGHLASVASQTEQNHILLKVLPNRLMTYNYWIGLSEERDSWKWSDGSPFLTNFFDRTDDHGQSDVQDCVGMNAQSGLWVKQNCEMGWGWVCEIAKGIYRDGEELATVPTPTHTNATCGLSSSGDWFYDANTDNCFFVSTTRDSWVNSEQTCNSMNSHLATIGKNEQGFVTKILSRHAPIDTLFWIGLRLKNPVLLTHNWVDGNLSSLFRAWDKDEPNPKGVQGCVVMKNRNGKWKDDYCTRASGYRFVCKKSKAAIVIGTTASPDVMENWGCPTNCTDCVRFRDSCYKFSAVGESKNWDQSREICRSIYQHPTDMSKSSDLVSIHDQLEQDFLFAHFVYDKYSRWIGLHEDYDRSTMFWSDQTPFDFSFWEGIEPLWSAQPECVHMYGEPSSYGGVGKWNDLACTAVAGYICKMKKDPSIPLQPDHPERRCDSGFEFLNGACFAVLPVPTNSNPDAVCSSQGGARMATITSAYEQPFVRYLFAKTQKEAPTFTGRAWLGGKVVNNRLSWNSGCYPSYNNIANFYTTAPQVETCVAMDYNGKWRTQPCTDTNQYVVCEKRVGSFLVECPKLKTENKGTCPPGFNDECHDYCYQVTHSSASGQSGNGMKATWENAKKACIALNGSIISIRNEQEQKCVENYVASSASTLWIGLYEDYDPLTKKGTWKWLDQDLAYQGNFMNWAIGEPNGLSDNGPNRESCAEIMSNGKWNNVPCGLSVARGYICEKQKIPLPTIPTIDKTTPVPVTFPQSSTATVEPVTLPPVTSSATTNAGTVSTASPVTSPVTNPVTNPATNPVTSQTPPVSSTPPQNGTDINEERPRSPEIPTSIGGGAIAGLAVTVLLLVPALTIAAFFFWRRRMAPTTGLAKKSISYQSGDQVPVIQDGDDAEA